MSRHTKAEWIAMALLVTLFIMSVYRAWTFSINLDEAYTYLSFVAPPWKQLFTSYSANHHVLYSLLAKASVSIFGLSEFTLRLPALFGAVLYLGAVFALTRTLFGRGWLMLLAVALLTMHPMVADYLSQARGYGLALAFFVIAMLGGLRFTSPRWLLLSGAAMGLCLGTNPAFAVPVLALTILIATACRGKQIAWLLLPEIVIAAAILGGPLLHADPSLLVGLPSAREAFDNFSIASVVHDWEGSPRLSLWKWLYPLFEWAFGITLIASLALLRDVRSRLFAGAFLLSVAMLIAIHRLSHLPWPYARVAIYLWPLMALSLCLLVQRYRLTRIPWLLFCLALITQFTLQTNLDHYGWLRYSAGTRQVAQSIMTRDPVTIAVSGPLFPCINFYKAMYAKKNWTVVPWTGSTSADYLILDIFASADGTRPGMKVIYRESLSKAIVTERRR